MSGSCGILFNSRALTRTCRFFFHRQPTSPFHAQDSATTDGQASTRSTRTRGHEEEKQTTHHIRRCRNTARRLQTVIITNDVRIQFQLRNTYTRSRPSFQCCVACRRRPSICDRMQSTSSMTSLREPNDLARMTARHRRLMLRFSARTTRPTAHNSQRTSRKKQMAK